MSTSMTLSDLLIATRQRADMVNSQFITDSELTSYINQSYFELYDLITNVHEMWNIAPPLTFQTDGTTQLYPLPDGVLYSAAPQFYKLWGVDLGLGAFNNNARVTLKRFQFIARNSYIYPQLSSSVLAVFNPAYDIVGSNIMFIPIPSANQFITLWYTPTLQTLNSPSDAVNGVSGWTEYIIVDAAIKCMQKEESDATLLMTQKEALIKRIEESAANRDTGQPESISNTRGRAGLSGYFGGPGSDGSYGGM